MMVPPNLPTHLDVDRVRRWEASLSLRFAARPTRTVLAENRHYGPLRVQRPFYPEGECCHIYLLHPPGGLVLGDQLLISVDAQRRTQSLITTPSAGKIYGVQGHQNTQSQSVQLNVEDGGCLEWLPQETIAFDGANGRLHTLLDLRGNARAMVWDMVCLGRPAAGEQFRSGRCDQTLEVRRDGRLLLVERNRYSGGDKLLRAPWGLWGAVTSGTFLATAEVDQMLVDQIRTQLNDLASGVEHRWGVTQKESLFIVRYLGASSRLCRKGFELVWSLLRPLVTGRAAAVPRIWST